MNELIQPGDEQKAVWKAEHLSRLFEEGDKALAVDEAQTIVMDSLIPGFDLKTHALREHSELSMMVTDIMAHAEGVGQLSRGAILHILLVDQVGAQTAQLLEEKARNNKAA